MFEKDITRRSKLTCSVNLLDSIESLQEIRVAVPSDIAMISQRIHGRARSVQVSYAGRNKGVSVRDIAAGLKSWRLG